jgi:predicted dehydrogenase
MDTKSIANTRIGRRTFLHSTAVIGAGLFIAPGAFGAGAAAKTPDSLNVGLIGLGEQCQRLVMQAIVKEEMDKKEAIHFKAICDIWPYKRKMIRGRLRYAKHDVTEYESYEKMLADETDLDAVIIATPDWMHAPISIACMKAGLHVYCEKEMSNSLGAAKKMVETSRATKKLLQIGHQRRSNPRYHAAKALVDKHRLLGKIKNINGQWNRCVASAKISVPVNKKIWVDGAVLKKHGYGTMDELINWRWYEKFGGGPLGDLGSHQIDIFSWFLGDVNPKSVLAVGGKDYFKMQHDEDVMAVYEYEGNAGIVRAFYQVLNTSGYGTYGTYFENFMGDHGTLLISERAGEKNNGWAFLEDYVMTDAKIKANWDARVKDGLLR